MKKILYLLLLLFSVFSTNMYAYDKYVTANLNLRNGPGTKYSVLTVIPRGTRVTIDEDCDCKWVPVEYNGRIGYISTKYLTNKKVTKSYTSTNKKVSSKNKGYSASNKKSSGRVKYYTNSKGHRVQSPTRYTSAPAGATALCRDGTYSFSQSRRGTCSHHGGVARWL